MKKSIINTFSKHFQTLTGHSPFPWQVALYDRFVTGDIPSTCEVPTGVGKTNVIAVWYIAWLHHPEILPRRLVYVVNRRTVVDQTTNEILNLRENLEKLSEFPKDVRKLAVSTLRGQYADNREWSADPSRPAVICGTVDMIGSRLLFSGYGIGFKSKPLHAGFLGQDVLLVHDEAHLEPAFQSLLNSIKQEQVRENIRSDSRVCPPLQVMELSATVRARPKQKAGSQVFHLTDEEREVPKKIPSPPAKPIHHVWQRLAAKKSLTLQPIPDEKQLAESITKTALHFKQSGLAILIYVRKVEDVEKIIKKLPKVTTKTLTGTLRGLERDDLVKSAVFQRFLPGPNQIEDHSPEENTAKETVFLVCTSAGEVGVNLSADHLVCDLSTWESMAQRFGRVNRFGDRTDTEIHVVLPTSLGKKGKLSELDERRQLTALLLEQLDGNASPAALRELSEQDKVAAFAPLPEILPATDILFDTWAMTTIQGKLSGRPAVEPYLHGVSEWQPPETVVAWREEVEVIRGDLLERYNPQDLLADYPLRPHELLRDRSDRIFAHFSKLAKKHHGSTAWIVKNDGTVMTKLLGELTDKKNKTLIESCTILLSPAVGGLEAGHLDGNSPIANDVSDQWFSENDQQRRKRFWAGPELVEDESRGMRLVRIIDKRLNAIDSEEERSENPQLWYWFELPRAGVSQDANTHLKPVLWTVHTDDVVREVKPLASCLVPTELRRTLELAAKFHDLGKKRSLFQRILGNFDAELLLAKAGRKRSHLPERYRHEFGSLLDVTQKDEFLDLPPDMQDLLLHLIAAHHGRARPHFPAEEAYDPAYTQAQAEAISAETVLRFARLQRKYGRWGLAYLESLLRAADWAASANPSKFAPEKTLLQEQMS